MAAKARTEAELLEEVLTSSGPVRLPYMHVNEKAPYLGSIYGQDIESAGEYLVIVPKVFWSRTIPRREYGYVTFRRPFVLQHVSTGPTGWKRSLSITFGGRTGKVLTKAMMKAGYDGVITWEPKYGFNECVRFDAKKRIVLRVP